MKHSLAASLSSFSALGRGILFHHWDTDGVAAAALIEQYFEEQGFGAKLLRYTPPIGNYFLTPKDIRWMRWRRPDFIITVDICLDRRDALMLKEVTKRIVIVDHHYQPKHPGIVQINPVADGKSTNEAPSTTWVINQELWPKEVKPLGILGMVGDQQEDIRKFKKFFPLVQKIGLEQRMTFDDFIHVTQRLHAIYVTNHRSEVVRSVSVLKKYDQQLKQILRISRYKWYQDNIAATVRKLMHVTPLEEDKRHVLYQFASRYHLIAEVTRRYADWYPDKIVITLMRHPNSRKLTSVYFRTQRTDVDMGVIVAFARTRKYNAGGKREVAGVLVPTDDALQFARDAYQLVA